MTENMKHEGENTMKNELTTEQARRLLAAIFSESDDNMPDDNMPDDNMPDDNMPDDNMPDNNYPETDEEKLGYSEFVLTNSLQYMGRAINRLSRLHHLLALKDLPDIIKRNELRMALEPLLQVENDVKDIAEMLTEVYRTTKPEVKKE